ncbi:MAG TPA: hypothetical protein VK619_18900 [Pyrinomonadaceae bacterium]|nr:hypothetical protein [Pyrinomonadaceae bacterium]
MKEDNSQGTEPSSQRLNYFNYFTEIEETFVRRRRKHLHLGTLDWALMSAWKEMGIPLHVVLRGIETAFDSYDARPRKRSVKTLMYCQEEVEAQYAEWMESQVGAPAEQSDEDSEVKTDDGQAANEDDARLPFPRAAILEHLSNARASLQNIYDERKGVDAFCDALGRAISRLHELETDFRRAARPDAELLEDSLTRLEKMLDEALLSSFSTAELIKARAVAVEQLEPYRNRMENEIFKQTYENLLFKTLRERRALPRLSLFYL